MIDSIYGILVDASKRCGAVLLIMLAGAGSGVADVAPDAHPLIVTINRASIASAAKKPVVADSHISVVSRRPGTVVDVPMFSSADKKFVVDVSQYEPVTLKLVDWPVDELMLLIGGELQITDKAGRTHVYTTGDAFVMPAGFSGTWRQLSQIQKVAVSYSVQSSAVVRPARKGAASEVVRIVNISDALLRDTEKDMRVLQGWNPYLTLMGSKQARYVEVPVFRSKDRKLEVHVKRFEPIDINLKNWPIDEFIHLINGHIELANSDGTVRSHGPGDTFVIPKGFSGRWRQSDTIDMFTAAYDSAATQ